jgi:acyl-CoA thioesterase I
MIEAAQASGADVIQLTPTPNLHEVLHGFGKPLRHHVKQVRMLAAKYQTGLADAFVGFEKWLATGRQITDAMAQHDHPNRQGHKIVAAELLHCFRK